jgi:hypothetical protein
MKRREFVHSVAGTILGVTVLKGAEQTTNPKAKNVIYIYLDGGLSHLDSFDPKQDKEVKGETDAIDTNVSGIQLGHRLPKLAQAMDKICLLRGMSSKTGAHRQAQYLNRTSFREIGTIIHPSLGSWTSKLIGNDTEIPDYVLVSGISSHPKAGFLEKSNSPLPVVDPNSGIKNIKTSSNFDKRLSLLKVIDSKIQGGTAGVINDYDAFYDNAIKFLNSEDLQLFDLSKEPEPKRNDYGKTKLGQGCLLAKRLVSGGVKFIEVNNGGWDTHVDNFTRLDTKLKELDDALSSLVKDLNSEGLLDETLVVLATDFGRTPKINVNDGRDHHPQAYSCLMIGAGIKGGQVVGETDKQGVKVIEDNFSIADVNCTVAQLLGINIKEDHYSPNGRPFKVANEGEVIQKALS